jgi:hypothetical protein
MSASVEGVDVAGGLDRGLVRFDAQRRWVVKTDTLRLPVGRIDGRDTPMIAEESRVPTRTGVATARRLERAHRAAPAIGRLAPETTIVDDPPPF